MKKITDQKTYAPILLYRFAKSLKQKGHEIRYRKDLNRLVIVNPGLILSASNYTGYFFVENSHINKFSCAFPASTNAQLIAKLVRFKVITLEKAEEWSNDVRPIWNKLH